MKDGEESIQLPFKSTGDLPDDIRVKWWRDDPEPMMMVHVYQNKSDQPDKPDEEYRGRTETSKELLETGNLSLTLKHPTVSDTGRYRCRVDSRNIWREKTVLLKVRGQYEGRHQRTFPPACFSNFIELKTPDSQLFDVFFNKANALLPTSGCT